MPMYEYRRTGEREQKRREKNKNKRGLNPNETLPQQRLMRLHHRAPAPLLGLWCCCRPRSLARRTSDGDSSTKPAPMLICCYRRYGARRCCRPRRCWTPVPYATRAPRGACDARTTRLERHVGGEKNG